MFKLKKENKQQIEKNDIKISLSEYLKEIEKFENHHLFPSPGFDECYKFIMKNTKNIQELLIVASFLKQIEISREELKKVYSISDEYIENVISEVVPTLRVEAYKRIKEELPKEKIMFFNESSEYLEPLYVELIDRIEYLFEVRRNKNILKKELKNTEILQKVIDNKAILILLNYYSVKESLIIAFNLDLVDIDEEELQNKYHYEEELFEKLFSESNIDYIINLLNERINKLKNIELETSFFEYQSLQQEYEDLLNRIEDTNRYLNSIKKR